MTRCPPAASIYRFILPNCISLERVTLPPALRSIGQYAFTNCKLLTDVSIPESIRFIGEGDFSDIPRLALRTVDDTVGARYAADGMLPPYNERYPEYGYGVVNVPEDDGTLALLEAWEEDAKVRAAMPTARRCRYCLWITTPSNGSRSP